jgi:VacB/RNase II family 3'-5' exoribonuclease
MWREVSLMNASEKQHRAILQKIARRAMLEKGLLPDFSKEAMNELSMINNHVPLNGNHVLDLRNLLWASIDNDDSLDLDQLTVAEALPGGKTKILVALADVDLMVKKGSAIDDHAHHNTTSVYTAAMIFPMIPERLSTGLTSLNFNQDRPAVIVEMVIGADGSLLDSDIYRALVRNHAKLTYKGVGAWLEGSGPLPDDVAAIKGLDENLRIQDSVAQSMKTFRHVHGALSLETVEARPIFKGDEIHDLEVEKKNHAKDIVEDFMLAANGVTARYLSSRNYPSLRRVVRTPKRWERIVEIAGEYGFRLPDTPDSRALEDFLINQKAVDPLRFPDLSLSIIKLMGPGEYVAELSGDTAPGHFGLAVKDYSHSTAPNRRYPDLVTQRLLKAAIAQTPAPYDKDSLEELSKHCTREEDAAKKVERQVEKSAEAMLFESRIGERFEAIVTGAAPKGTWVRLLHPPIEGKLVQGFEGIDVGHRIAVQLIHTDIEQGFIDFKRVD